MIVFAIPVFSKVSCPFYLLQNSMGCLLQIPSPGPRLDRQSLDAGALESALVPRAPSDSPAPLLPSEGVGA